MQLLGPDDKWPMLWGRRISYPNCRIPSKTKMFRDQAIFSLEAEEVVWICSSKHTHSAPDLCHTFYTSHLLPTIQRKSLITETASFVRKMPLRLRAGWYRNFSRTPVKQPTKIRRAITVPNYSHSLLNRYRAGGWKQDERPRGVSDRETTPGIRKFPCVRNLSFQTFLFINFLRIELFHLIQI